MSDKRMRRRRKTASAKNTKPSAILGGIALIVAGLQVQNTVLKVVLICVGLVLVVGVLMSLFRG